MNRFILFTCVFLLTFKTFAQSQSDKLKSLQEKLDQVSEQIGEGDEVDFRKISENIALLEKTLRQKDSLNLSINLLNTQLMLAEAKLRKCGKSSNVLKHESMLLYKNNSTKIDEQEKTKLDNIIASYKLEGTESKKLFIIGHTDSLGNSNFNMQLSKRRVESVKRYIRSKRCCF